MNNIKETCESFLEQWDRSEWMQAHGGWASEEFEEKREAYDDALASFREAVEELPDGESVKYDNKHELHMIEVELKLLKEAMLALEGQVNPDESDYIAEGTIDPDNLKEGSESLDIGHCYQGWDCQEGWEAYRKGDALVVQWFRHAIGNRHERDLWVLVDEDFFS